MSVSTKHIHVEAAARCWPVWAASGYGTTRPSGGAAKSGSLTLRAREAACYRHTHDQDVTMRAASVSALHDHSKTGRSKSEHVQAC